MVVREDVKKKNRRTKNRNSKEIEGNIVKFVGINSAGINSQLHSFDQMLSELQPEMWFLQETKLRRNGTLKTQNCPKYQIFELVRKNSGGGGLAMGALHCLNPTWLGEGNDEVECLSIEITIDRFRIRCVNAYGPQEHDGAERKEKFWSYLDQEVEAAENQGTGFILQMDGNLWAGSHLIPGDPHSQNQNGKLFEQFLGRNPHLFVVNSLDVCQGLITRFRKTVKCEEKSVLDFFVICYKVRSFLKRMIVDQERDHCLTNFNPAKIGQKVKESDHNPLIMELQMKYHQSRPDRVELFNFKNIECQEVFRNLTNQTTKFTGCFENNDSFEIQSKTWKKTLWSFFHQSFKKVRLTEEGRVRVDPISNLLEKRKELKKQIKDNDDDESLENELQEMEKEIAKATEEENKEIIMNNFKTLGDRHDTVNINGMWGLKKKLFPKIAQSKPTGKRNTAGQIITNPDGLKNLYLETFVHRLRHRPIREDFKDIKFLKEQLFQMRLSLAKKTKSENWSLKQLEKVLSSLKCNKARDPHGVINELFRPDVIGQDLKLSLLQLLNGIKDNCFIPDFMEWANIASVYKGKGDKLDLNNDRGIFLVTVFRGILMRMIYNDKYDVIDANMSDSQVGARKKKNIRNHIFIVNGIINDVLQDKSKAVDIEIMDYKQCFDSMWLEDALNDLYDSGVKDDTLAILHEANKNVKVAVKTPHGLTERKNVEKIILQGDVFGPIECSVSVDTYGKECLQDEKHLYSYKGEVEVPPLAMVDDLLIVSECGYKTTMVNAFINTKSNMKKLQFGTAKCHKMHVGNKRIEEICPDLYVDGWRLKEVSDIQTGESDIFDEYEGMQQMDKVDEEKYLGDILSADGKNVKNITARCNKSIGTRNQIMGILQEVFYGKYYFQVAKVLRNSLFLSSLLTNCEAWYNVSKVETEMLEEVDEMLLRNILECPRSTPTEMLYLELNCLPVRFILIKRRLHFLYYILNQDRSSLIFTFYQAQMRNSSKGDWTTTVQEDLEILGIEKEIEQLGSMSENGFSKLISGQIEKEALKYLNREKSVHSKVKHIIHTKMEMMDYLCPNILTIDEMKLLFQARARMWELKCNYRGKYLNTDTLCPVCVSEQDTQAHLLECSELSEENEIVRGSVKYENLFSECLSEKVDVLRIMKDRFKRRKVILKKKTKEKPILAQVIQ